jgi:hypothetical protein
VQIIETEEKRELDTSNRSVGKKTKDASLRPALDK